ncbi:ParB/RepB/Spo0J family partition protein [Aliishimia ponticola]|uniref:ParB/RepB/Spo0J family partition protein n=1 Tax=Aliishimia ponticola TaxID=2499833 RepID=A0A4S4N5G3_9RHOB|nr:ParB/RepB/Spo0J family partition protein [Aliishimia ponticola]THH34324.1 ParB/RepB/Spo0J family partition protein [Aliishimia ponticola]
MSKRHDAIFDDVLKDFDETAPQKDRAGARFLKRSTTLAEQASGQRQEKTLRLVDPATCTMWDRHNRAYAELNEDNTRDLIDGLLSQGQQEFPAIVRRLRPAHEGQGPEFEVICGARRHFAVSWLRANNYPRFLYLIEERELTDEEAFRLADIENRDREDISDYERARDYAAALNHYYGGLQKVMAERLQVREEWLSRYLNLGRLDPIIIAAFPSVRDIREVHARQLKPLMKASAGAEAILAEAQRISAERKEGQSIPAAKVMSRLKSAATPPKARRAADEVVGKAGQGVQVRRKGKRVTLEFARDLSDDALRQAVEEFIVARST